MAMDKEIEPIKERKKRKMSTIKQERTAIKTKEVIEKNLDMTGGQILEFIGYSDGIVKNPQMVFNSEGFKAAMKQLGFSVSAADLTIAKILQTGKEENQIKASQEIYKRLGAYEQGEGESSKVVVAVQVIINGTNNIESRTDGEAIVSP